LGLYPCGGGAVGFHNPLLKQGLRSFEHPANWVCIGFVLGLIGFDWVCFSSSEGAVGFHNPLL
jgi:hypothetical protein